MEFLKDVYTMIKRAVIALESLAETQASVLAIVKSEACQCCSPAQEAAEKASTECVVTPLEGGGCVKTPLPSPEKLRAASTEAQITRDHLKAILTDRGIKFKDSARTETLSRMVAESAVKPIEAQAEAAQMASENWSEPVAPKEITKEEVRLALVACSAAKGFDIAKAILLEKGGASILSEVPVENYAAILEGCKLV
jgi:hypothetical protein